MEISLEHGLRRFELPALPDPWGGFQLEMEYDEFLLHCIGCYLFSLSVLESCIFIFISHGYGEL